MKNCSIVKRYIYALLFFVWSSSVIWSASRLQKVPEIEFPHIDKILHAIYYAPGGYFSFLFLKAFGISSGVLSFFMGAIVGILDEFIQSFVPGRSVDLFDFLADCIGLAMGVILARWRVSLSNFP